MALELWYPCYPDPMYAHTVGTFAAPTLLGRSSKVPAWALCIRPPACPCHPDISTEQALMLFKDRIFSKMPLASLGTESHFPTDYTTL